MSKLSRLADDVVAVTQARYEQHLARVKRKIEINNAVGCVPEYAIGEMMASKILINAAMNEAYWQAARAMCRRCAEGVPLVKLPYLDGTVELIHEIPHEKLGKVEENCQAGPIHALMEKLIEDKP